MRALVADGINQRRKHVSGKKDGTEQIFKMVVAAESMRRLSTLSRRTLMASRSKSVTSH
jgi:hypothetical protein